MRRLLLTVEPEDRRWLWGAAGIIALALSLVALLPGG